MDVLKDYISVTMVREDLEELPECDWPEGFGVRWFQAGDEVIWYDIQEDADQFDIVHSGLFQQEFGDDTQAHSERMCFVINDQGESIGTTAVWYGHHADQGRVHWVAIRPGWQGQGLARSMLCTILQRMKQLGYRRSVLGTQTPRVTAINLYLSLGFIPEIKSDEDRTIWTQLAGHLKYPVDISFVQ